ncbi:M24 family metallopeptidase [Lacticaseibacillus zhaodongensis]|uniref:M24 family metallopeptidase n=1 Tax=Lacticaseibacillus zhaodongensis TaxID=2668065 RepID=UPI0012D2ECBF|nr:aminopeptidase P family protein [Lacticaseibacillus zhaodongensis]
MAKFKEVRAAMAKQGVDALVLTNPINVSYVSDFSGDESGLVVTQNEAALVTDSRFIEVAKSEVHEADVLMHTKGLLPFMGALVDKYGAKKVGFESAYMTFFDYDTLRKNTKAELVQTWHLVEQIREIKSPDEVELIQKAIDIAQAGYEHVLKTIKPGMTERAVATDLDFFMRGLGATAVSFETIVASGYRSALPHGFADDKVIEDGDVITLDWGAIYKGYMSDLTRTFAIGTPNPKIDEIYKYVFQANRELAASMKPGVLGKELQATAHRAIDAAGYKDYFGHGAGHGIGRDIHEGPGAWGPYWETPILAGNVVTDEPGIYLPGIGGVRIEDDIQITADGHKQLSITAPAELLHI